MAIDLSRFTKRKSDEVRIGNLALGGSQALRLQSMTTTDTNDVEASIGQCVKILDAGGELVRLTTQGIREANQIKFIKEGLEKRGYHQPLVADVHFNAQVAFEAAKYADKVRINPGNFVDPVKRFSEIEYTEESYHAEIQKIEDKFTPFLETCKKYHTAIRIGVNHGSLSDRIMSKYGDTAMGMVASCMEYLRIARKNDFNNIVISIKASNTRIMVQTVRLLDKVMGDENMAFPLHLGVTEAGEGEDGRIKSAVGIGALLADGIGDTIRVSLSEDPEMEIPVCEVLKAHFAEYNTTLRLPHVNPDLYTPFEYNPRSTSKFFEIGGGQVPVIAVGVADKLIYIEGSTPEWVYDAQMDVMMHVQSEEPVLMETVERHHPKEPGFIFCTLADLTPQFAHDLQGKYKCLLVKAESKNVFTELRHCVLKATELGIKQAIMVQVDVEYLSDKAKIGIAADYGGLLVDGMINGLFLKSEKEDSKTLTDFGLSLFQAARARFSKTEYISCPGCGRTLFDLQTTIAKVKKATAHLKGLKVAVMGCIVNGPGEMADADYGYVGAGIGRISLYKGKECLKKGIAEDDAISELIKILKAHKVWVEPSK